MKTKTRWIVFGLSLILCFAFFQCSDGAGKPGEPLPGIGTLGGLCRDDGTCDDNLVCEEGICIEYLYVNPIFPPGVSITAPVENEIISGSPYRIVAEAGGDFDIERVEFYDGDTKLGEDTDGQDGWAYDWKPTFASDGAHQLMARVYDDHDGEGESESVNVTVRLSTFARTYGGDTVESIQATSDGGYIAASPIYTNGPVNQKAKILKLKSNGDIDWQKTYDGNNIDTVYSIRQTDDGGYIAAGTTTSFGTGQSDVWVLKLSPDGAVIWQKTYGGAGNEIAYSIRQGSDGGYIVAGNADSFAPKSSEIWILKLKANGEPSWEKTYGGNKDDYAASVEETSDGGYIVAGKSYSFIPGYGYEFWILKLDQDGNTVWQKTFGNSSKNAEARSIQQTSDGGYIVAGDTFDNSRLAWVFKLTPDGSISWEKTYGGDKSDYAHSIQQTSDGGYIVAGRTNSFGSGQEDAWVLKLDSGGNMSWQRTYGGSNDDNANSIQQTTDGGYVVAGSTQTFGIGILDSWILKLKPDGTIDPSCPADLGKESSATAMGSTAIVGTTDILPVDSLATVEDTTATVTDSTSATDAQCHN